MESLVIFTNNEKETSELGRRLGQGLDAGSVVALFGGLGAGKTALVRGIAEGLGAAGRVTSPTFTIVNEYQGTPPLFHFDMYRIEGPDELFEIGWDDYLERGGVCCVEWSENIAAALPDSAVTVKIEKLDGDARRIEIGGAAL